MSRAEHDSGHGSDPYAAIPERFRNRKRWLLWDASADTPRQPHWRGDFGISWSDPDDWRSFEAAVNAAQERESWGIGYVFQPGDDEYMIDVDGPYADDGTPRDWFPGLDRFAEAGAYMEWSPSGNGVHIPIVGTPPEWWRDSDVAPDKHQGVDVLENKFCTFTGDTLDESGNTVAEVNAGGFLFECYQNLRDESPALETTEPESYDGDDWLTDDQVENALAAIDPDPPHLEWIKLGYAVHDYDPGPTGKRLFTEWSRQGEKWDRDAERSIESLWSNATQGDDVGVGTLVHKAKEAGWEPDTRDATPTVDAGNDTTLADAVTSDWFDTNQKVVHVENVAGYGSDEVVALFENPDELPTEVIGAIYQVEGGGEFLHDPDEWDVRERAPSDPFQDLSTHELKNEALRRTPIDRVAYLPTREEWFWCDDAGVWQRHGEEYLREWLDDLLGQHYRRQIRTEVMDQLKARVRANETAFGGGPPGTIATKSGLVDLDTGECRPIEPDDRVRWRLGTEYDPDAECAKWKEFLGEVAEPEAIPTLQEYVGYCLRHWDLPFKKALILFGPTDAGKSVFLDVIRALFGGDESPATTSTSIQYLANERWGAARLVNTAVNIRNDLDNSTIENIGKVKEIIAGDALDAERKRKPVFKFSPTAKHIFAANRAPERNVDDEAFWNRWLTVMFPESMPRDEQNPKLTDELTAELPGILNWAIAGYQRLIEQGGFTDDPLPYQTRDKWERYGNSIEQWLERYTEKAEAFTPKYSTDNTLGAYDSYVAFARQNGLEVELDDQFTSELKRREGIGKTQRRLDGERPHGYAGFVLTDDAPGTINAEEEDDAEEGPQPTGLDGYD